MPEHTLRPTKTWKASPFKAVKPKNVDARRLPETSIVYKAKYTRKLMMKDAEETSIVMRFSQFMSEVLPPGDDAFDTTAPKVQKVHNAFRSRLGIKPADGSSTMDLQEKVYSQAWVSTILAELGFYADSHAAQSR